MTKERIDELDRLSSCAITECQLRDKADDAALAFWRGVKAVVEELKMELTESEHRFPGPPVRLRD